MALQVLAIEAAKGADLVVLPELAATDYHFENHGAAARVAEPAGAGATFQALGPVAAEHGVWIVVGFVEDAGADLYNSAMVIDPTGQLRFTYRKTFLYELDSLWATAGDSGYACFEVEGMRFTVGICMDLNDDGFVTWCRDESARVIAFPTKWIDEGYVPWAYWAWRLKGTSTAIVAANSYGSEGETGFCGLSAIIDGSRLLAAARAEGDEVIVAALG